MSDTESKRTVSTSPACEKSKRQMFVDWLQRIIPVRRMKTQEFWRQNEDVIDGWEWVASKSLRTCGFCLAMDGERFPLKVSFSALGRCSGKYCRCTHIAVMDDVPRPARTLGREWFETLSDTEKLTILGQEKWIEYNTGRSLTEIFGV